MNRVELKNKAKELIRGNKWYILKPAIIFGLAVFLIELIAIGIDYATGGITVEKVMVLGVETTNYSGGIITSIVSFFTGLFSAAFGVAYAYYILSFIRGKRMEMNDIVNWIKAHWSISIIVTILVGLIIIGCSILLVIPGIIAAIGLQFYQEVCADNTDMSAKDIISKAWNMTKGHKLDLFVLALSFIGWALLAPFTLGILYIWLAPYITVTLTLAYEELKK